MPTLYLDFETTSGDPKVKALNPWQGDTCKVLGFSYAIDDGDVTYIDYFHRADKEELKQFVQQLLDYCDTWVNHNVKFDMHLCVNDLGLKLRDSMQYVCTLTACKIYDSDRMSYSLDDVVFDFCGVDIRHHAGVFKRYLIRNHDYGAIPTDLMADYANDDVKSNRILYKWLLENIPEECHGVWKTEIALTYELFMMEQRGMPTTVDLLRKAQVRAMAAMLGNQMLLDEKIGYTVDPTNSKDIHQVLCGTFGMPVLSYTDTGGPSFDKAALKMYAIHPGAPVEVIEAIQRYKKASTFLSLFVTDWLQRLKDDRLHPTYNQAVRTGRMSCSEPNAQQLSEEAKELIVPPPGWSVWSMDQSQIEFRFIAHYTEVKEVLDAYNKDPDTDFHVWVAEMCGIARKPAKNVNFGIAFGEGIKKLTSQLTSDPSIIEWATANSKSPEQFHQLVAARAAEVMEKYLRVMYNLKPTMKAASAALKAKGFIRNWYGRHRKMPIYRYFDGVKRDMSYKAFNNLNQSSAADLMKERTVAFCQAVRGTQIYALGQVHDELFGIAPTHIAEDPRMVVDALSIMEWPAPPKPLLVPIRCTYGSSRESWKAASKAATTFKYERRLEGLFDWAKS